MSELRVLSLFTGVGGFDLGFDLAGFEGLFAYPLDRQGYVLLHELIHLRSGEQSHAGPWWGTLDEYERATAQEE